MHRALPERGDGGIGQGEPLVCVGKTVGSNPLIRTEMIYDTLCERTITSLWVDRSSVDFEYSVVVSDLEPFADRRSPGVSQAAARFQRSLVQ